MPSHTGYVFRQFEEQWKKGLLQGFIVGSIFGAIVTMELYKSRR